MAIGLKLAGISKMAKSGITASLKEQGTAILIMMGVAIISVLAMIVLVLFKANVPNSTTTTNATIDLFVTAFALTGSFAAINILIIIVKGIIGVVRGLQ